MHLKRLPGSKYRQERFNRFSGYDRRLPGAVQRRVSIKTFLKVFYFFQKKSI